jgi:REP element-mobilizing transposase RayT
MKNKQEMQYRRSIRLKDYDYATPGIYFLTICVEGRKDQFGEIIDDRMLLNEFGYIIDVAWREIPERISVVRIDEFVIMPNHLHGLIEIHDRQLSPDEKRWNLGQIVAYFKYESTKRYNSLLESGDLRKLWQRNYYEHIVRNERGLVAIREYISRNPLNWAEDPDNVANR